MTHTNAKGQTFSLYQGTTKTGKPKYYFAMQSEGTLAKAIPPGYEIYENPNAQVFLRRIPPKIITDEECQVVEEGMRKYAEVKDYKVDVRGNAILIYTADQDMDTIAALVCNPHASREENTRRMTLLRQGIHYSPMLVFQLVDVTRRTVSDPTLLLPWVGGRLDRDWPAREVVHAGQKVCQASRPGFICRIVVRAYGSPSQRTCLASPRWSTTSIWMGGGNISSSI